MSLFGEVRQWLSTNIRRAQQWLATDKTYAEQIMPIRRNGGWVLLTNLTLVLLIGSQFIATEISIAALLWSASGASLGAAGLISWWRSRNLEITEENAAAMARKIALFAGIRGTHWSIGFLLFMPYATPVAQTALGWALVGLMCGGCYAYNTLPKAAFAYVVLLTAGGAGAFMSAGHLILSILTVALVGFGLILVLGAAANTRLLHRHIEQEKLLAEQNEFMGILLKDFEDGATDWLFEIGSDLCLTRGGARFTENLDYSTDFLERRPITNVLRNRTVNEEQRRTIESLARALASGEAFSNTIVHFGIGSQERYWQLSAKPIARSDGAWRGVVSDITAQQQSQARVTHLALHDSLTGLSNRVYFRERLAEAIAAQANSPCTRWVMCIDLDGFKGVNDTLGHQAGDRLLAAVSQRLTAGADRQDIVSRMGGDEFAILTGPMPGGELAKATKLINLIAEPYDINGHTVTIGTSIGLAGIGDANSSMSDVLRHADLALYRAKVEGKGLARTFEPWMDHALQHRLRTETELKDAVAKGEFTLHFQPIVTIATGDIAGYEALVRWQHPVRGLVSPGEFIDVAEEAGLIGAIGEWVIAEACRHAAAWPAHLRVSVNLAPQQIKSARLGAAVVKALDESGIRPQRLELEITETALLEETDAVLATLNQLKTLGIRIGLDDFGTGYSSLGYLHRFAFDNIKIDRSFIQAMNKRAQSAAVVKAVLSLAVDLGIPTTAEGIETAEQLEALRERGCTEAQGYLFGRPTADPLSQLELRLRA